MICAIIRNVRDVINRLTTTLRSTKARSVSSARTAGTATVSNTGAINKRWTYSTIRCEFCARVDHSELYVWNTHELRECTFEGHGDYPPMNAVTDNEGRLLVSPMGTTCSFFMSRAW